MENKDLQILAEMSDLAASVRRQLEELEEMINQFKSAHEENAEYQYDEEEAPIDIDIEDLHVDESRNPAEEVETEPVEETAPARQAVIDVLEDKRAWKTDMPGAPVRDIRSAISLNDRVLFINRLFNEDPLAFQEMLSRINNMTSLDEVVAAVMAEHPDWDLGSEMVYRFMMAVRRKVR